jgi:uncharacterized protein (TIGR00266 family)
MKYEIKNQPFTVLALQMDAGEEIKCQSGAMAWMSPGIQMETKTGGLGGMFKKAIAGESLALNHYRAEQAGELTLAKHSPGDIKMFNIGETPIIAQKTSFLAATMGVEMDIFLQKKLSAGLFGGEGFILQRISGNGIAFAEFDGHVVEYELKPGQQIVVDTGYLAAMEATCQIDIQTVPGIKNAVFGGEGLFHTVITGPGRIWLQSMPIYSVANAIRPYIPTGN